MPVLAPWLCGKVGAMSSPWGPGLPSWTGTHRQSLPSSSLSRINPITGSMMGKWIQRGGFLLVSSWQKFPLEQRETNYSVFYIRHFIPSCECSAWLLPSGGGQGTPHLLIQMRTDAVDKGHLTGRLSYMVDGVQTAALMEKPVKGSCRWDFFWRFRGGCSSF